jgi:hypothetical protein
VREKERVLGNLVNAFNFRQKPRKPLLLPTLTPAQLQAGSLPGILGTLAMGLEKLGP